jgi:hypothetical protein
MLNLGLMKIRLVSASNHFIELQPWNRLAAPDHQQKEQPKNYGSIEFHNTPSFY